MSQRYILIGIVVVLTLSIIFRLADIKQVFSLSDDDAVLSAPNLTIPSRTPTSAPANTAAPNPTKPGGSGSSTAVPTSTGQATATPTINFAATPVEGFVPTAESCGVPPTILVQNPTNVRSGPSVNYPIVTQLVFLEVRFILGHAANAQWWLIQLDDADIGWVANDVVTVQGYIGGIPVLPAPPINGQTPTPGPLWNPTPLPFCTVTPTVTAVPSATPEPTIAVNDSLAGTTGEQHTPEAGENPGPTETPEPQPSQTAVSPPTLPPTQSASQLETIDAESTVTAAEQTTSGSPTDWLLPVVGLLLVASGVAAFTFRRQK